MKNKSKSILFASIAVLFWSTVPTAFKLGLNEYTPVQLILIASFVSVLILGTVLVFQGKSTLLLKQSKKEFTSSLLLGAFNPFIYYIILFKGIFIIACTIGTTPEYDLADCYFNFIGTHAWAKNKLEKFCRPGNKLYRGRYYLFPGRPKGISKHKYITGVLLALASSVMWALYWTLNVKDKRDEILKLFLNFVTGFILLLIATAFFSDFHFHWGTGFWAAIYIGFFEVGVTYILWMNAMKLSQKQCNYWEPCVFCPIYFTSIYFFNFERSDLLHYFHWNYFHCRRGFISTN